MPLGRQGDCRSLGDGFDSRTKRQARVAQLVAQLPYKETVAGSFPAPSTADLKLIW